MFYFTKVAVPLFWLNHPH